MKPQITPRDSINVPSIDLRFVRNIILKALALFLVVNLLFGLSDPSPLLGRVSAYNHLFPGRLRLPYSDDPQHAYNLSLYNLEAMFASHELAAGQKPPGEYRVFLIGDSSTWGFLLPSDQTLAAYLNAAGYTLSDGRQVKVYNLGYPVMSLTKDLLILSRAMQYDPDLIVWPVTLESFPYDNQLFPPLLQHNREPVRDLITGYHLNLNPDDPRLIRPSIWDRTIIGERRDLADLVRLQLYGSMWAATGIDQTIPESYTPRQEDLSADVAFHNLQPPHLSPSDLAFDALKAGVKMAGDIPILIINEPMFVSQGKNSDIRYNFYYPRWAYDDYRRLLAEQSSANGWHTLDLWDSVDNNEFTNSAVHMTPKGTAQFADQVGQAVLQIAGSGK
jgi:hypothetical protein